MQSLPQSLQASLMATAFLAWVGRGDKRASWSPCNQRVLKNTGRQPNKNLDAGALALSSSTFLGQKMLDVNLESRKLASTLFAINRSHRPWLPFCHGCNGCRLSETRVRSSGTQSYFIVSSSYNISYLCHIQSYHVSGRISKPCILCPGKGSPPPLKELILVPKN